jgi:hypothetical protein
MARLPQPGGDDGVWGNILNEYLEVSLNSDGTLQPGALTQAGAIRTGYNAGGDLSGTYPNPSVSSIKGVSISGTASDGQVLTATSASEATWQDIIGDTTYIGNTPVTYVELRPVQAALIGNAYGFGSIPSYNTTSGEVPTDGIPIATTIYGEASGALTVDGYSVQTGDRIAVWDNNYYATTDTAGIYIVTDPGSVSDTFLLTRSDDTFADGSTGNIFWSAPVANSAMYGTGLSIRCTPATDFTHVAVLALTMASGFSNGNGSAPYPYSYAEGQGFAGDQYAHAEGSGTAAYMAHAEGSSNAGGSFSHSESGSSAGGDFSHSEGGSNAQGLYSHAETQSTASADYSHSEGFANAYTYGQTAHSSGTLYANYAQHSSVTGSYYTYDGSTVTLTPSYGNPTLVFPGWNMTAIIKARVVGRRTDASGTVSSWEIDGVIDGDGVSTYRWVSGSAPTPTLIAQDPAAAEWATAISLDSSNKSLSVTATGVDGMEILWLVVIDLYEVTV